MTQTCETYAPLPVVNGSSLAHGSPSLVETKSFVMPIPLSDISIARRRVMQTFDLFSFCTRVIRTAWLTPSQPLGGADPIASLTDMRTHPSS